MASLNKASLIGRLGKDPERLTTKSGKEGSKFTLATSRKVNDQEITQWHNVLVWSEMNARYVNDYAKKGYLLYVEGEIEYVTDEYNGTKRYFTNIVVHQFDGRIQILTSKSEAQRDPSYAESKGGEKARARQPAKQAPDNLENDLDDFIPF